MPVFESRVLRKIFWLKREEVIGGLKKVYHDGLHDFYSQYIIYQDDHIKEGEMGMAFSTCGGEVPTGFL